GRLYRIGKLCKFHVHGPPLLDLCFDYVARLSKRSFDPAPHDAEPNQKSRKQREHGKVGDIFTGDTETVEWRSKKVIEGEFSDCKCDDGRPRSRVPTR